MSTRLLPKGNPLTDTMPFTDPQGVEWVAYIEGLPPADRCSLLARTQLPRRRLRFDSAADSRLCPTLPAGSPFLAERRLALLLAQSPRLADVEASKPLSIPRRQAWRNAVRRAELLARRAQAALTVGVHEAHLAVARVTSGGRIRP